MIFLEAIFKNFFYCINVAIVYSTFFNFPHVNNFAVNAFTTPALADFYTAWYDT